MNTIEQLVNKTQFGNGDSDGHLLTLFSLALASKGKTFIELGVRNGDTTFPLLTAAHLNGGKLYSVDTEKTKFQPDHMLKPHWEFIESDTLTFLQGWRPTGRDIDLVFVDDWHSYPHVKKELELLDAIVSPKTIILLHDLMYGDTCPFYHTDLTLKDGQWAEGGVYRAVAELNPQFWEFATLPYNNGLTLLRKKYSNKFKRK